MCNLYGETGLSEWLQSGTYGGDEDESMTVNERLITALEPLGYPIAPDRYTGEETVYLTFNYGVRGALFADDAPGYDVYLVQVHLFAPYGWNSVALRGQVKRRLFAAGFTWPEETDAGSAQEQREGQHIVFECEMGEGAVPDG